MDRPTKQARIDAFRRLCREQGLPLTEQRMTVLEVVLDLDNHPTADQVHEAVARRDPGVSRATVYRALESLARIGVITKACHHFDLANWWMGDAPETVFAFGERRFFAFFS